MYSLPTTVKVKDREFHIRDKGDYRMVLDCFSALQDEELSEDYRVLASLLIFYNEFTGLEDIWQYEKYIPELCGTVLEVLKTKGRKCGIVALTYNAKFKTYSNTPKMDYLGLTQRQKQTQEKEQKQKQEKIPW